ncbi:ABC transporter C family member 6, partial [Mucuna pruriens]
MTFQQCLLGLLKTKTLIYITHQEEFLPDADLLLVMNSNIGIYYYRSDTDFMELVGAHREALSSVMLALSPPKDTGSLSDFELEQKVKSVDDTVESKGQLVQEEEQEKGRTLTVAWTILETPISVNVETVIKSFTLMIVNVALAIGSSFFILVKSVLAVVAGYKAATMLFNKMHATPSGRICNRVS